MNPPAYTITRESITIIWQNKSHVVQKEAPQFGNLRAAILEERWDDIPNHLTVHNNLKIWAKGEFTIGDSGELLYRGEVLPEDLHSRIHEMTTAGEDPTSLFNFWERLQKNPSFRSVSQLFSFLNHGGIPITPDGCFLAYKGVNDDYTDRYTGKIDNRPGTKHKMPRNKISDDPKEECHYGYHVGAEQYASTFGSRVVVCKVDPEHVVCVPYDCSREKMRVCEYEVIGNYGNTLPSTTYDDKQDLATAGSQAHECAGDDSECEEGLLEDLEDESPPEENLEKDLEEKSEEKIPDVGEVEGFEKRKSKKGFPKFDRMGFEELTKQSIESLRRYAGKGLRIIGASKIPGGKPALISAILKVRA